MSVTTGEDAAEDRRRQLALLTELREVEHWCRLVAARIDLAVAAVAAVDEPVRPRTCRPPRPCRSACANSSGWPAPGHARGEVEALLRLRAVQRDLDAYARALRATTRVATQDLREPARRPGRPAAAGARRRGRRAPVILLEARRRRRRDPDGVA